MKNRRTVLVAFLLVATMVMGIGYAAYSGLLNIDGTASYYNPDQDTVEGLIQITNAEGYDSDVTVSGLNSQNVEVTVVFDQADAVANVIEKTIKFTVTYDASAITATDAVIPNVIIREGTGTGTDANALQTSDAALTVDTDLEETLMSTAKTTQTFTMTIKLDTSSLVNTTTAAEYTFKVPVEYEFTQATSLS